MMSVMLHSNTVSSLSLQALRAALSGRQVASHSTAAGLPLAPPPAHWDAPKYAAACLETFALDLNPSGVPHCVAAMLCSDVCPRQLLCPALC